jgi:polysaccharide biosynthesis protein PslG
MRALHSKPLILGAVLMVTATLLSGCAVAGQAPIPDDGTTAQALAPAALRDRIGIAPGNATLFEPNDAVRRQALKAIADTGARWVTVDFDWNAINGASPGDLRWGPTDLFVREARELGLRIIAVPAYSPAWARPANCPPGDTHCLPASPETYATFVRLSAQRYGSLSAIPDLRNSITAWQIWNEPNHYPFVQYVDVPHYTAILKRAYVEIKRGDPTATVIAGGTAPAPDDPSGRDMKPVTFLRGIYANGGKGFFDAFGHHPYSFPCSPLVNADWNAFTQTQYLHNIMVQNGDGAKKIWGTESGAPTGSNVGPCTDGPNVSVTEATQAQFVDEYIKGWTQDFGKFTGPLIWFQIRDNGTNRAFWEHNLGLVRRDFSPKPAWHRMRQRLLG